VPAMETWLLASPQRAITPFFGLLRDEAILQAATARAHTAERAQGNCVAPADPQRLPHGRRVGRGPDCAPNMPVLVHAAGSHRRRYGAVTEGGTATAPYRPLRRVVGASSGLLGLACGVGMNGISHVHEGMRHVMGMSACDISWA